MMAKRMENGKQYRNLIGSMNKQLKLRNKELEDVKQKLGSNHLDHIEKILIKLSIIRVDKF